MRILILIPLFCAMVAAPVRAERLTVVELFTSQGCSSCPPADALLADLARTDPTLLPLGLHVTYWDRLGWKDPYSLPAATRRQRDFSAQMRLDTVYTPQIVVDGRHEAVGLDRDAVRRAIAAARAEPAAATLSLVAGPDGLRMRAGPGSEAGTLVLVGFDRQHATAVRAGENGGRTLTEVNVVRSLAPVGSWSGEAIDLVLPRPSGERAAVLLQAPDGRILAAAQTP
jgi:hypothetical protein